MLIVNVYLQYHTSHFHLFCDGSDDTLVITTAVGSKCNLPYFFLKGYTHLYSHFCDFQAKTAHETCNHTQRVDLNIVYVNWNIVTIGPMIRDTC